MKVRLPDFAGVALVDILANGLAMLIIVIVLSIAARTEREERTTAQVEEVETMMSRRFSTSLVLNSLAASPPARLHDYQASPLDQQHDPHLLPILELHRDFVREFYSGAVWGREELLREPNAMDAWLTGFDEERKQRLRVDVYDVAQFYLAMSILRDHGISARHWHFLPGGLGMAQAGHCPPGVAAQDCRGGPGGGSSALPALGLDSGSGNSGGGGPGGADTWPPGDFPGAADDALDGAGSGPLPGGAALGGFGGFGGDPAGGGGGEANGGGLGAGPGGNGLAGGAPGLGAGSFPNARPGLGGQSRGLLDGNPDGAGQSGMRFRLSSPESLRDQSQALGGDGAPSPEQILAALIDFTGKLQASLDAGASPSALLANFEMFMRRALAAPPAPDGHARELLRALLLEISWSALGLQDQLPLEVMPLELAARANTTLIVEPNRRLQGVAVGRAGDGDAPPLPDAARPVLRLNAHPDIWRGLSVPLERNAILLLPPEQRHPERLRWRALAYIAPGFDDFIIGFTYAALDAAGRLVVQAEDNRVRLDGHPLRTAHPEAVFGTRGWLVALYAGLALGLLTLLLVVRRLTAERRR